MRLRAALAVLLLVSCTTPPPTVASPSATSAGPRATASATGTPPASVTPSPPPDFDADPKIANSKRGLIDQLVMVEAAIRDPAVTGKRLGWMGHLQQLVYSTLADSPEWQPDALAALPNDRQRGAVTGALEAIKQTRAIHGPVPKTLPDWKILAPKPIETLLGYYREAEARFGVGWEYLAAIHLIETRMGRIRGLSTAGAQGPMQFMPATWAAYGMGGDVNDDRDAITGAANYLKRSGAPADMQRALFAYNHSQPYVNAMLAYAKVLKADPDAYRGYHGWEVYYTSEETGTVHLPVGWTKPKS